MSSTPVKLSAFAGSDNVVDALFDNERMLACDAELIDRCSDRRKWGGRARERDPGAEAGRRAANVIQLYSHDTLGLVLI